jgi:hypothetical protein
VQSWEKFALMPFLELGQIRINALTACLSSTLDRAVQQRGIATINRNVKIWNP